MNFVLVNHQLEVRFDTYAITFHINLKMNLQNWSHHLLRYLNPKRSNIIIGYIYRHPNMDLDKFNDNYLNTLLDKISKENKSVFLLGDFNVDLLKYDKHAPTNEFLDSLSSHMFLHILSHQLESVLLPKPLLIIFFKYSYFKLCLR